MSYVKDVFGRDLQLFDKFFIGFDDQINKMTKFHDELAKNIPNYPPYNIRKTGDNKYVIEIAVAGFSKSELEITIEDEKLIVKGSAKESAENDYLFKGIGMRDFTRMFALNDHVEIRGAAMVNGMLKIALERLTPEHKKPKKVDIEDEPSTVSEYAQHNAKPVFLTEEDQ